MSTPPAAADPTIERHRQRLEESLAKLRKALRHWQVLSAEYEAFREELQGLPDGASREEMVSSAPSPPPRWVWESLLSGMR